MPSFALFFLSVVVVYYRGKGATSYSVQPRQAIGLFVEWGGNTQPGVVKKYTVTIDVKCYVHSLHHVPAA